MRRVEPLQHSPDEAAWRNQVQGLLSTLEAATQAAAAASNGPQQQAGGQQRAPGSGQLDRGLAWQEYRTNGQQVGRW